MHLPKTGTVEIAPSVLSADFGQLADEIEQIRSAGIKLVHLDIMDGHFVPNITMGPPVVKSLRKHSDLVFDCHLMVTDPETYSERFIQAGADHITFHIETTDKPAELLEKIHQAGCTAGICLNPDTPVETIEEAGPLCDMILIMTVHPGFGAQKFIAEAAKKTVRVREIVGPDIRVQIDGGIGPETAATVVAYGADTLVAGNAVFGKNDRIEAINAIRAAVQ